MKLDVHTTRSHQSFWCTKCDRNIVDSEKPETGNFHIQFGHTFNPKTKSFDGEGDYVGVMFALCAECVGQPEEETRI